MAIDFHGGPRSSLLTWLSGAPVRIGYRVAGRSWMYTTRVPRPRELRPRHSVENQWDLLSAARTSRRRIAARFPVEMSPDPHVVAAVVERLARAGVDCRRSRDRRPRQRRQPVPALAGRAFVCPRHRAGGARSAAARHRHVRVPRTGDAAGGVIDQARAARLRPTATASCRAASSRSPSCARSSIDRRCYIGGDSGPLHVAATTTRADRRDSTARRCLSDRRRGGMRSGSPSRSTSMAAASAGPCDQRTLRARRLPLPYLVATRTGDRSRRTRLARAAVKDV